MALLWNTVPNTKNLFVADLSDGENVGRFTVKRVPRRRKDPWQAHFEGSLRTGPTTLRRECQQNFIATEAEAKAICEGWMSGKPAGRVLMEINAKRAAEAASQA
ncbi:MAG: hypothetical protein KGL39_55960 [Patescibacteria group bacterium]|nr:hypothetical protein [Patescibacteria group bacterium]